MGMTKKAGTILLQKNKFQNIYFYSVIYFLLCFSLLFYYRNVGTFIDEYDNIVGGMMVASGLDVYSGYVSQHTPLMYYLCAVFKLLGANFLLPFRLLFYGFLSLWHTVLFIRYRKYFGNYVMFLFPVVFLTSFAFSNNGFAHMILSDQVQAVALLTLFFEWIVYAKTREFGIKNAIVLSFGIFCSIGVAVVSAYFIILICFGIIILEIQNIHKNECRLIGVTRAFFRKHWTTAIIILIPFIVLILHYAVTGHLRDFYYQAFQFNVEVYAKYSNYSGNMIKNFGYAINYFFGIIITYCNRFTTDFFTSMRVLLNYGCDVLFVIWLFRKDKFVSIFTGMLILSMGTRGFEGFHATAFWAISAFIISIEMISGIKILRERNKNGQRTAALVVLFSVICMPYLSNFSNLCPKPSDFQRPVYPDTTEEYYVNKILKPDEGFYVSTLNEGLYLNTNRLSTTRFGSLVPWFSDVYQNDIISDLDKTKTKLIICDPNYDVWGYKFYNYASDLYRYIQKNYKLLPCQAPYIYIRNEYYADVVNQLGLEPAAYSADDTQITPLGPIIDAKQVAQVFTATTDTVSRVDVKIGTYARVNQSKLKMTLSEADSGKVLVSENLDVPNLVDNSFAPVKFAAVPVRKGKQYRISFAANGTTSTDFVTIYRTTTNADEKAGHAVVDGNKQNFNLDIKVYGK